ncbi:DUF1771-domain-containing protein [Phlegmacium glaucopus]|nr:DUF1771-domain-containing protein [Phlegmacium glaucopus]
MWTDIFKFVLNLFCRPTETQQYPQEQHPESYPTSDQWQHRPPQKHQDANQINQDNESYLSLRARANEHGDKMAQCFQQSHEAYARRDGALAKDLSNQGKEHQRKMEELNKQASDWIFIENNKDSKPGEIDLHGLYVKEAISRADQCIQLAKSNGTSQIRLIVGKGLHSHGGVAKIKPAIEELIQKHKLVAQLDPNNQGVLIVYLDSSSSHGIGAEEISRRLVHENDACVIM